MTIQKKLTPEDLKKLEAVHKDFPYHCTLCGKDQWSLAEYLFEVPGYGATAFPGTAIATFPALILTCNTCGNAVFLSAIKLGIVSTKFEDK